METEYQVVISSRAAQMLVSHAAFLARVSAAAAEQLTQAFARAANSLATMPLRCPLLAQPYLPRNKYRYLLFAKRYMLVFQVAGSTVYVDYVLDCRQDYEWLLD